jgi:hypothetical protein
MIRKTISLSPLSPPSATPRSLADHGQPSHFDVLAHSRHPVARRHRGKLNAAAIEEPIAADAPPTRGTPQPRLVLVIVLIIVLELKFFWHECKLKYD